MNNDHLLGTELLVDDFDQLSLNQLSKSSPSVFQVKRSRSSKQQRTILGRNNSNTNTNILINNINNNNGNSKPSNLSHVPCKFFKQGTCTAGANCVFSHSQDLTSDSAVCKYFLKGNCKFGSKCALLHTLSPVDNTGRSKLLQHGTVATGATGATTAAARRKIQGSMSTTTMTSSSTSQAIPIMSNTTAAANNNNNNYLLVASPPDPRPYLNLTRDELNINYGNNNNNSELSAAIRQNNIMLASASAPNADPSPLNNNFDKKYLLSPTTFTSSQNSLLNPQQQYHHRHTFSQQQQSDEEDGIMIGRGGIGIVGRGGGGGGNGHNTNNDEDVLLPSSLNDLLTPAELNRSRDRMLYHPSSSSYHNNNNNNSRSPLGLSPFDMPPAPPPSVQSSSWHVPFLHRASSSFTTTPSIDEQQQDHLSLLSSSPSGSKAINIPGDHSHHRMTSASLLYRTGNGTTTTTTTGTGTSPSDEDDDPFSPFGNNMDELIFMQDEGPEQVKSNSNNTTTSQSHHFQRMFSNQVAFPSLVHNSVPRS